MLYIIVFIITVFLFIIYTTPKTCFITFSDSKYKKTRERITEQAKNLKCFDDIYSFGEEDLDSNFLEKHRNFIESNNRGYGYWIWKPQVIKQVLEKVQQNSIIVYADVGCTFDDKKINDLQNYIRELDDENGILAFQWDGDSESSWSKMDCINKIYPKGSESPQIIATCIFIKKNKFSYKFICEWLNYCEQYHLLDDSESVAKNAENFKEHRHDQSIFSLLCKKYNIKTTDNTVDKDGPIRASRLKY